VAQKVTNLGYEAKQMKRQTAKAIIEGNPKGINGENQKEIKWQMDLVGYSIPSIEFR
jgi:hypothetical protein